MKHISIYSLLFVIILSACGQAVTPTTEPVDIQATAIVLASTMAAQTGASIPTTILVPPTATPKPRPTRTATSLLPTLSSSLSITPTNTTSGGCNQALVSWEGPSTNLTLGNETKQDIGLSLSVTTPMGECGYLWYTYKNPITVTVPVGCFSAFAYVGKKSTVSGYDCINESNWSVIVKNDRIVFKGGCAAKGGC
ncbi:MAG: hypothetical protein MUP03_06215 [Anaerolineales bacterium]|nr:hypothetical protein [Anaerolineales bacterium]